MEDLIRKLVDEGIVKYGKVTLSSGEKSDIYYDIKKAYGNTEIRKELASRIYSLLDKKPNFIAACDIGGIPLATTISDIFDLNLTLIRTKQKDHGTKNTIECYIPNNFDEGIIVDDVFTTGSNLRYMIDIIKSETNAKILVCYVVLKRTNNKFEYPLFNLFSDLDFRK